MHDFQIGRLRQIISSDLGDEKTNISAHTYDQKVVM